MQTGRALAVVRKAAPTLALLAPKLLDAETRERLVEAGKGLAARSPRRQLAAKVEVTALLAERMAAEARTPEERDRAAAWNERARKLRIRLDLPVVGRKARAEHRRSVLEQLGRLQAEMDRELDV
ncbi:hypothetical protein G5V58_19545 [Nocardioides anomalus]|uniref:Uncharacterized protein n=1 Tax=Nocardioides anomalus TaxID=2712223 RepID=A0A6G6WHZ5_9ACTN|nr:hypothetical protein [Nocardioides anomalus]QIG44680.1 hypothetical protein G5V58_19545 [Nocardioides anomalus]